MYQIRAGFFVILQPIENRISASFKLRYPYESGKFKIRYNHYRDLTRRTSDAVHGTAWDGKSCLSLPKMKVPFFPDLLGVWENLKLPPHASF